MVSKIYSLEDGLKIMEAMEKGADLNTELAKATPIGTIEITEVE